MIKYSQVKLSLDIVSTRDKRKGQKREESGQENDVIKAISLRVYVIA